MSPISSIDSKQPSEELMVYLARLEVIVVQD